MARALDGLFGCLLHSGPACTECRSERCIKAAQCLVGDSGTGKSHLLIALGTEAAMKGFRVHRTLAIKLVNELVEAAEDSQFLQNAPSAVRKAS